MPGPVEDVVEGDFVGYGGGVGEVGVDFDALISETMRSGGLLRASR